jgi:hypothetical protein
VINFTSGLAPLMDNKGNTYSYGTPAPGHFGIAYCINPVVGTGHTWSFSPGGGGYPSVALQRAERHVRELQENVRRAEERAALAERSARDAWSFARVFHRPLPEHTNGRRFAAMSQMRSARKGPPSLRARP